LIEALAGVKIVDIGAGGWTSAAVSSFGDLYTFGWNPNGQLGILVSDENPAVYATPQIIEFAEEELSIDSVACGSRHTLIRTSDNCYFVSGSNKYGQLGLSGVEMPLKHGHDPDDIFIDKFTKIEGITEKFNISCGYWSSLLTEYRPK
jgi:alpha-tubulin suppressor-like RCC1 family protein